MSISVLEATTEIIKSAVSGAPLPLISENQRNELIKSIEVIYKKLLELERS